MLLQIDGLDKQWEEGVPSDWEGELGANNPDDCRMHAPFAIQRLNNPELQDFGSRQHEQRVARIRAADNDILAEDDASTSVRQTAEGAIYVNSLSYSDFRDRLIVNFDILHRTNRIQWPTRKKPPPLASDVINN
jgi:hypothetical protein